MQNTIWLSPHNNSNPFTVALHQTNKLYSVQILIYLCAHVCCMSNTVSLCSGHQLNATEGHTTISLYSGWDYTDFTSLAHIPLRPPNDYYPLSDVLSSGQTLEGAHVNLLAIVRQVRGWILSLLPCMYVSPYKMAAKGDSFQP